jgi:hypothetical protein
VVVVGVMKGTKLWRCEREGCECGAQKCQCARRSSERSSSSSSSSNSSRER